MQTPWHMTPILNDERVFFNLHVPGDSSINVACVLFNLHLIAYGGQDVTWTF